MKTLIFVLISTLLIINATEVVNQDNCTADYYECEKVSTGTWPHCCNLKALGGCFSKMTTQQVCQKCLTDKSCEGFSFVNTNGGGCYKTSCAKPCDRGYGKDANIDYWKPVLRKCLRAQPKPVPAVQEITQDNCTKDFYTCEKVQTGTWPHCCNLQSLGGCFSKMTTQQVCQRCLSDGKCEGFSFVNTNGGGCYKTNCAKPCHRGSGKDANIDYWKPKLNVCLRAQPKPVPAVQEITQENCTKDFYTCEKVQTGTWPHCCNLQSLGGCFSKMTTQDVCQRCLSDGKCEGFSYINTNGGGCYKTNCAKPCHAGSGKDANIDYWKPKLNVCARAQPKPVPTPAPVVPEEITQDNCTADFKTCVKVSTGTWPHCCNLKALGGCFSKKTTQQVCKRCVANGNCEGFSFINTNGGGCYKTSCAKPCHRGSGKDPNIDYYKIVTEKCLRAQEEPEVEPPRPTAVEPEEEPRPTAVEPEAPVETGVEPAEPERDCESFVPQSGANCATLYMECGCTGESLQYCGSATSLGKFKNFKCIIVPEGFKVLIYDQQCFQGEPTVFTKSVDCVEQPTLLQTSNSFIERSTCKKSGIAPLKNAHKSQSHLKGHSQKKHI